MMSVRLDTIKANGRKRIDEVAVGRVEEGDDVIVRLLLGDGGGRPCNAKVYWDSMKLFPLEVKPALSGSSSSKILCMPPDMCCTCEQHTCEWQKPFSYLNSNQTYLNDSPWDLECNFVLGQGKSVKGNLNEVSFISFAWPS